MPRRPPSASPLSQYIKGFYPVLSHTLRTDLFPAIARSIYNCRRHSLNLLSLSTRLKQWRSPNPKAVKLVCISDTHNQTPALPSGDVLIHAGDLSDTGEPLEIQRQLDWINAQPHQHKIVIAGNHDGFLDEKFRWPSLKDIQLRWGDIVYLQNTLTVLKLDNGRKLRIYGSPFTPSNYHEPFAYKREEQDVFSNKLPVDLDVLITHFPCRHHLCGSKGDGEAKLLKELWRIKPRVHVFGHIHRGRGQDLLYYDEFQKRYEAFSENGGTIEDLRSMLTSWSIRSKGPTTRLINASIDRDPHGFLRNFPDKFTRPGRPHTVII